MRKLKNAALKEEIELIAEDIRVPEAQREGFVEEALAISVLIRRRRAYHAMKKCHREISSTKKLEQAQEHLFKALSILNAQRYALCDILQTDVSNGIGSLLDHPSAMNLRLDLGLLELSERHDLLIPRRQVSTGLLPPPEPAASFLDLLEMLHQSLRRAVEANPRRCGGRRRYALRDEYLEALQQLYEQTFGVPATPTPTGKFVDMCELLLPSYDQSTVGLEVAIKRFLANKAQEVD